mgnify:CR=1 FL=1
MNTLYYFCDESSLSDQYMAVAGLAVPGDVYREIASQLRRLKIANGSSPDSEIKWEKTHDRFYCAETAFAKYLANQVHSGRLHFHILFARRTEFNHRLSGPLRVYDTVGKLYYQLLLHRALKFYGGAARLHIRPDKGDCGKKLGPNKLVLLDEAVGRYGRKYGVTKNSIASLEQADSATESLLQLTDVTLGAFTAWKNERHLKPRTKRVIPKNRLSRLVRDLYGCPDLDEDTNKDVRDFSIWRFRPAGMKGQLRFPGLESPVD